MKSFLTDNPQQNNLSTLDLNKFRAKLQNQFKSTSNTNISTLQDLNINSLLRKNSEKD